jgi:hypothetical protein
MSEHRVLGFKPQPRLERRGQNGQNGTEQPDHFASLGDSITSSTRIRFSVHTGPAGWFFVYRHPESPAGDEDKDFLPGIQPLSVFDALWTLS